MKFKLLSLSLFSLSAVSTFVLPSLTPSAMAGCVAVDVSTQVAVDGSRSRRQSNQVNQDFGRNCNGSGSTVTTVGNQLCVSGGTCEQRRTSNQYVDGNSNYRSNVRTPNIRVNVGVPVHVRNAAEKYRR
jgi:hypothetical protein